ncbi:hypothetical protein [Ovoidimarina sediminis]|uniref:hypothetical protein n=1 Tax=Ovoidimarina sediminis TaxID=3079856 RepID=UPI002930AC3B|nr:hypothetical protein [Rhodophyticola sp. MJ-SS7]
MRPERGSRGLPLAGLNRGIGGRGAAAAWARVPGDAALPTRPELLVAASGVGVGYAVAGIVADEAHVPAGATRGVGAAP